MRIATLSIFLLLILGASALRTNLRSQSMGVFDIPQATCAAVPGVTTVEESVEVPAAIASETETVTDVIVTTTEVGGEELTVILPSPDTYAEEAPLEVVTDSEGETYVVQVLESYETATGESVVVANIGGEAITIEAEITPVTLPLAPIVSEGEVSVVEVSSVAEIGGETYVFVPTGDGETEAITAEVVTEIVTEVPETLVETATEIPSVIADSGEITYDTTITTTTIGGEEYTVILPSESEVGAPLEIVTTGTGESVVVQVVESYEAANGESVVVANVGEGESVTFVGEIVPTELPLAAIVSEGETSIVEVVETTTTETGETIVSYLTETGDIETIAGELTIEPVTEIPSEIIEAPEVVEVSEAVTTYLEETETNVETTTVVIGGEEITVIVPSGDSDAPLEVVTTGDGEAVIVQVVDTYETESGENVVVADIGGETVTIEGEVVVTEAPLAIVESDGETSIVEVVETTTTVTGETIISYITETGDIAVAEAELITERSTEVEVAEVPEVVTETIGETTTEVETTTVELDGEGFTVILPSETETEAPLEIVTTGEGEAVIVQVVETYETESGENVVVANIGGEEVTIEGEVVPTEVPIVAVVTDDGEVSVVEVVEVTTSTTGENTVSYLTEDGYVETIEATVVTEITGETQTVVECSTSAVTVDESGSIVTVPVEVVVEPVAEVPTELLTVPEVPESIVESGELTYDSTITTTTIGGEEYTVVLPSTEDIVEAAPLEIITDSEGESMVVQVVESYETDSGENVVVANIGGETVTIEAEITTIETPIAPVVVEGEVVVVEATEVITNDEGETVIVVSTGEGETTTIVTEEVLVSTEAEVTETLIVSPDEYPAAIIEEVDVTDSDTTITTTTIGGEEYTVYLPSDETYVDQAPLVPVTDSEGETYVVQVVENYETESGESVVVANIGGETVTIEAEIDTLVSPIVTVVANEETYVVEEVDVVTTDLGETVVLVPTESGEVEQIGAEVTSEVVTEIPTEIVEEEVLPAVISEESENINEEEIIYTTTIVDNEEYTVILPSEDTYVEDAPLVPITDSEGESYVVQVLESYETETGESVVVANIGGEAVTIEAEITDIEAPIAPVVIEGEISVVEITEVKTIAGGETVIVVPTGESGETTTVAAELVVETTTEIPTELVSVPEELPAVIATETEATTSEVITTTTTVGGEELTVYLPSEENYVENAPLLPITDSEGESYVVQVLESYETETGESVVVANIGGEAVTIEAEITDVVTPLAPVVVEGEVTVVEVQEVTTNDEGETVVVVPTGNGETTTITVEEVVEIATEVPEEVIEVPEELPATIAAEVEEETDVIYTTVTIDTEEYDVFLPNEEDYAEDAPLEIITDSEGDTYVVQVLESYETDSGESVVVANIGGEAVTIEAEIESTTTPITPIVTDGEVAVVEVSEVTTIAGGATVVVVPTGEGETTVIDVEGYVEPVTEIPTEFVPAGDTLPEAITDAEEVDDEEIIYTTTTIDSEEYTVLLPSEDTYAEEAPLVAITDSEGDEYVVQVLESYETDSGESVVVANIGGEAVTIEAEIISTESTATPVVIEGEVTVVATSDIQTIAGGETAVVTTDAEGETVTVAAETAVEVVTEIPTELVPAGETLPAVISEESENIDEEEIIYTTTIIDNEEYTVILPSEETYVEEAPLLPIIDSEEDEYVVQVLETYETESGESVVVANIGGEAVTIEAEVINVATPITPVVVEGEVTVLAVEEVLTTPAGETVVVVPTGNGETTVITVEEVAEIVTAIPEEVPEIPEVEEEPAFCA